MNDQEVEQKIVQLTEVLNNPSARRKINALSILHDIFYNTHESRDLSVENADVLNETALLLVSPQLRTVLLKHRLDAYGLHFAALSLTEIDDVIKDLSCYGGLKNLIPHGLFYRLKEELLGPIQPNSLNESMMEPAASQTKIINKEQPDHLYNSLLKSVRSGGRGCIMDSLKDLVNDDQFNVKSFGAKDLLKQSAKRLLSAEVSDLLEKLYLGEYLYLLAVNYILDMDALKRDVSTGDVLKNSLPQAAFYNLQRELALKTTGAEQVLVGGIQGQSTIHELLKKMQRLSSSNPIYDQATAPNPNIPSQHRFAEKIRRRSHFMEENASGMELYQLPLKRTASSRTSKTKRWVFGERSSANVECKTILLMGATGSGKTTLINAMVNYVLGVEWDDPFRFLLISEEGPNSQAHSQTSKVTAYELHYQVGFRVPYSLIIVDTPGYGDTKGIERDHQITDSIQQFFKDEKGIRVSLSL